MPGLLRGVARTAVVAGTATAVSGRVQRRQAARYADKDAELAATREQAYEQAYEQKSAQAQPAAAPPAQAAAAPQPDMLEQLKTLGELKAQGVLTEDEFNTQKARILAGG
jgi:hypothetical protein